MAAARSRKKSPLAVVFASLASVDRFADAGREHARKTEATARQRAAERRAARARFDDATALSPAENAELAALALRTVLGARADTCIYRSPFHCLPRATNQLQLSS
jgi:hypothetical protein